MFCKFNVWLDARSLIGLYCDILSPDSSDVCSTVSSLLQLQVSCKSAKALDVDGRPLRGALEWLAWGID